MEKLKQNYILILFFILAIGGGYMTGNDPKDKSRRIVQRFMKNYKIPGLSVTVGESGEVIWSEGFGLADIEQNILVTTTTRFRIGSVSKIVTSAAVGRLLDQQKLDLLFIDGDHTYRSVLADWLIYKNFVAKGGIIAFHDCVGNDDGFGVPKLLKKIKSFDSKIKLKKIVNSKNFGIAYYYKS